MDDGDGDLLLHPVQEVVGGVAGHRDGGAPRPLQHAGVGKQALIDLVLLCLGAQDGRGAVGHGAVGKNQHREVLLIGAGVGAVDDILIKGVGGLGAHAPDDAKTVVAHLKYLI